MWKHVLLNKLSRFINFFSHEDVTILLLTQYILGMMVMGNSWDWSQGSKAIVCENEIRLGISFDAAHTVATP